MKTLLSEDYLKTLRERAKKSRVRFRYQSLGLHIAEVLDDRAHKTLYMKLVKEYNGDLLLAVAKDIALRENVKNKGGYFMRVFSKFRNSMPRKTSPEEKKRKQLKLRLRRKR